MNPILFKNYSQMNLCAGVIHNTKSLKKSISFQLTVYTIRIILKSTTIHIRKKNEGLSSWMLMKA